MKKEKDRWFLRLLALLALGGLLSTAAFAAEAGSSSDPLVTLSYLNNTFLNQILQTVDQKIDARTGQNTIPAGNDTAAFEVVALSGGQTLTGTLGCEVLLRIGSASCVASSEPGLVDETSGGSLSSGGVLEPNHLYLMTVEGRGVQASGSVTLLVRGDYSIS